MATVAGVPGFTQLSKLNCTEELRIQGVVVQTEGPGSRSNWVLVKEKADLPAPVGGVITLNFNVDYEINGAIDLVADVIEGNGQNVVYGLNNETDRIITNSANPLFSVTDGRLRLRDLEFENPSGPVINLTDTGGDSSSFSLTGCLTRNIGSLGTIADVSSVDISNNVFIDPGNGINFSGSGIIANFTNNITTVDTPGTLIDLLTAIFDAVNINGNYLRASVATTFIDAEADSANITATGQGSIVNNITIGTTPNVVGLTTGDLRWEIGANNTLPDSINSASLFMADNVTSTTIAAIAVDVKVAGTTTFNTDTSRFEMPSNNTLRYLGRKQLQLNLTYSVSASRTSGSGNLLFTFTIYKNGSPLSGAQQTLELDSRERSLTIIASDSASTNDEYELFVRNEDSTGDVTVSDLTLVASE